MSIYIQYENPDAVYYPGQAVSGIVTLELYDEVHARAVTIEARGKAHCHWTKSESSGNGNSRSVSYSSTIRYCNLKAEAWTPRDDEERLQPGVSRFAFSFILPPVLPPSYEGDIGYIRYKIKVEIDRVWRFDTENEEYFTVLPRVDLNRIPQALEPLVDRQSKDVGMILFRHGDISYEACILKTGFVPGEPITMVATIDNASTRPVNYISVKLKKCSRFTAFRSGWTTEFEPGMTVKAGGTTRENKLVIAELEKEIYIEPSSRMQVQVALEVPSTVPSSNTCPTIVVDYYVSFKIQSEGMVNNTIKSKFPVIIGTVPFTTDQPQRSGPPLYPALSDVDASAPPLEGEEPPPYPSDEALPSAPPPTYEESVYGKRKAGENAAAPSDEQRQRRFVPRYPFYRSLSIPSEIVASSSAPLEFRGESIPEEDPK